MGKNQYWKKAHKLYREYCVKPLFFVGKGYKEKALKPLDLRALLNLSTFICGMDGTRTRDPLRDRQEKASIQS